MRWIIVVGLMLLSALIAGYVPVLISYRKAMGA